jgi:hypothetical protein
LGADASARPALAAPFVGRAPEMAALLDELDASRRGARTVVVVGDSGRGKTALVRAFLRALAARAPDALVLSSRCYERELLPFKAFDGIVEQLAEHLASLGAADLARVTPPDAALLARVFPVLRRVAAFDDALAAEGTPLQQRARAFAALRALLAAMARDRALVLSIDDLQWSDADSLALMGDLLEPPDAPRALVVATMRPPASGAPDPLDAIDARAGGVHRVALGPLPADDARTLVAHALGPTADTSLASTIVSEAAGHPLFLLALADHAKIGERALGRVKLDDAIWARVESVEARARRLLELVAVAGEPLVTRAGMIAASMDHAAYAGTADALRVARLTRTTGAGRDDEVEPYHDRVRETVLARIDDARRRECHARLARALEDTGRGEADPQSLVRHLAGAGDTERAAEHAERAATRALAGFAFDQAAELYKGALAYTRDDARRRALRAALADTLASAGRGTEAAEAHLACAAGASAEERIDHQRRAADHLIRSGHVERGTQILSGVLGEYGEALPKSTAVAALRMLAPRLLPRVRALRWTPRDETSCPHAELRRFDAFHTVSISLCLVDTVRGGAFQTRSVALALALGEPRRVGRALTLEACYVGSTGTRGLQRGRRILEEVTKIAASTGEPYLEGCRFLVDGFLDYHAGRFRAAGEKFVDGERAFRAARGTYFEAGFCQWFRFVALRNRGMIGEIERGFDEWARDAERRGDRFNETSIRYNLNGVWLARDDVDGARRDLARTPWAPPAGGFHLQHWYEAAARAEIALYAGEHAAHLPELRATFARLARSMIPRMRIHRATSHWTAARVLVACAASSPRARALLAEAERYAR